MKLNITRDGYLAIGLLIGLLITLICGLNLYRFGIDWAYGVVIGAIIMSFFAIIHDFEI